MELKINNLSKTYSNGVQALTVPVKKNKNTPTREILIDYSEDWQKNHLRAILSAYKNSPFYEHYIDDFIQFFETKEQYLFDLNIKILDKVFSILEFEKNYRFSDEYFAEPESIDFRTSIHPKTSKNLEDKDFKSISYIQVFSERHGFTGNLSILDLIFNEGPLCLTNLQTSIVG